MTTKIAALKEVLIRNYEAIGWQLERLELIPYESQRVLRGILVCPCGGREYFNMMIEPAELAALRCINGLAESILQQSASREHLMRDVAEGKLPATLDIDKHCFKGLV